MKAASLIDRRSFLDGVGAASAALAVPALAGQSHSGQGTLIVSPDGSDDALGTATHPLRSLERALQLCLTHPVTTVLLRAGIYELARPLEIARGDRPLHIGAYANQQVVLSGGTRLEVAWHPYREGIYQASVPKGTTTDQLFINGQRQIMARYPNFDAKARYLNGTARDAFDPGRVAGWSNPENGYIHALQQSLWGSLHYKILGKNPDNTLRYEGGWQIDRDQPMHKEFRFVENIFEELDVPGEWYLNETTSVLYFYPPEGMDLSHATVDIVRLKNLLTIGNSASQPVSDVTITGLTFRHTLRTFMETREPLLRSDWRIYRGGALYLENTENISIEDCFFDQVGGNAVFVSGHNRNVRIRRCHFDSSGASGVCFVGRPEAVRDPLSTYSQTQSLNSIDLAPGPRSEAYPKDCSVEDCLIVATGRFEKQTAGVEISMAQAISVSRCSIYGVPRAGVNIGDGTWGSHTIEYCDVFETVLETSDHGAFNSWGRDRWWKLKGADPDTLLLEPSTRALPTLDAMLPNTIKYSRWACEHGWDIDLDDGSTNYRILGNLCLCGGIKLREGFLRVVENNIMVRNTLHPHVWPSDSEDVIRRNIVFVPYRPVRPKSWGKQVDFSLLHTPGMSKPRSAVALQTLSHQDAHSIQADAHFVDQAKGNFRVRDGSPAISLGFQNLSMNQYGVRTPRLRALSRQPDIAHLLLVEPATLREGPKKDVTLWMGATVRNLSGMGEVSALGAPGMTGVVVESVSAGSHAEAAGLQPNDLILAIEDQNIADIALLLRTSKQWEQHESIALSVLRHQQLRSLTLFTR